MTSTASEPAALADVSSSTTLWRRLLRLGLSVILAAIAVGLMAGGTILLHTRAETSGPQVQPPAPVVLVDRVVRLGSYRQHRRFVGQIESARQTALAFEQPGRILDLLVDEGQVVKARQTIARLDRRALEAALAQQRASRKALEVDKQLAQLEAARQRQLKGGGYASGQAYDAARLRVAGLDARLAQNDAALRSIKIDLSKTILRAPFAGTVGQLFQESGATVVPGTPILTLFERAAPQVKVGLPRQLARTLKPGREMKLLVDGEIITARIAQLRPDLDARTRTVGVLLDVVASSRGAGRTWLYGQSVELLVDDQVSADGFWVPQTALKEGVRGLWTIITAGESGDTVDGEVVLGQSVVEVLHVEGARVYVRGGLADGQRFVTTGLHRLAKGVVVRVRNDEPIKKSGS